MACDCGGGGGRRSPGNRDRIMLRGLLFHGYHGVFVEENKLGQKFLVDVDAWTDLSKAGESDAMEDSVSYADLYNQVKVIVEGPPFKLVEAVANAIAKALLSAHPLTISDVRVKKRELQEDIGGYRVGNVGPRRRPWKFFRSGLLIAWIC